MSQCDAILAMLQRGETVTPLSAYAACGTLACHSRVAELRERGYAIACKIHSDGALRWGEYRLSEPIPFAGWL